MSGELCLRNHQRVQPVDLRLLRRIIRHILAERLRLADFDLTVHLVNADEMARLNQTYMQHAGSTDVITLDYGGAADKSVTGEIFVCMDEAMLQARRFKATWQEELLRYVIHGVLHLQGHDDTSDGPRKIMKREEARRLREAGRDFHLRKLRRKPTVGM